MSGSPAEMGRSYIQIISRAPFRTIWAVHTRLFFVQITTFSEIQICDLADLCADCPRLRTCFPAEHLERVHAVRVGNLTCRDDLLAIFVSFHPKIWDKLAPLTNGLNPKNFTKAH